MNNRITQALLLALVITQVPGLYTAATKYSSERAAYQACFAWKMKAPEKTTTHTAKEPTRTYKTDGTVDISYHTWETKETVSRDCYFEQETDQWVGTQEGKPVTTFRF